MLSLSGERARQHDSTVRGGYVDGDPTGIWVVNGDVTHDGGVLSGGCLNVHAECLFAQRQAVTVNADCVVVHGVSLSLWVPSGTTPAQYASTEPK